MSKEQPKKISENKLSGTKWSHPAYGCLSVSRTNCHKMTLFGTDIQSNSFISFKLSKANEIINDSFSMISPTEVIAEFKMSANQFTQMLTSLNSGEGTPVTLETVPEYSKLIRVADLPDKDPLEETINFEAKHAVKQDLKKIVDALSNLASLKQNPTISKKQFSEKIFELETAVCNLPKNVDYLFRLIDEKVERSITQAKAEVEAYTSNKLMSLGIESVKGITPEIEKK